MTRSGENVTGAAREDALEIARGGGERSGRFSTFIAAVALLFSAFSFYETVLRRPDMRVFVPPVIKYAHPGRNNFEVFNIPLTLSNFGARPGTVLSLDLTVTNVKSGEKKRFYSAAIGEWRKAKTGGVQSFKPISVAGKMSHSTDLLFYTREGEQINRITDQEGGSFQFDLTLNLVPVDDIWLLDKIWPSKVAPVRFEMSIGALDYRYFNNNGTMDMRAKDYRATVGGQ